MGYRLGSNSHSSSASSGSALARVETAGARTRPKKSVGAAAGISALSCLPVFAVPYCSARRCTVEVVSALACPRRLAISASICRSVSFVLAHRPPHSRLAPLVGVLRIVQQRYRQRAYHHSARTRRWRLDVSPGYTKNADSGQLIRTFGWFSQQKRLIRKFVNTATLYTLSTHGSRRIIGCPSSVWSCQKRNPRGIISSTRRESTAFSPALTMLAFTCKVR